jgi:hypothetical protein
LDLLTEVYQDFYATNNPHLKIISELDAQSVGNIVATMLISKFNADIFLLRKIVRELEIDRDDLTGHLKLAYQVEDEKQPLSVIINALFQANARRSLVCEVDDIDIYKTKKIVPVYRTLASVGLKSLKHESLYKIEGREDIEDAYRLNWLYYVLHLHSFKTPPSGAVMSEEDDADCAFSMRKGVKTPCWALENVDIDHDEKEVVFKSDEEKEAFYEEWGYEPDEQPLEIQQMAICKIENVTDWVAFYKKYRGVVEIDEELLREL